LNKLRTFTAWALDAAPRPRDRSRSTTVTGTSQRHSASLAERERPSTKPSTASRNACEAKIASLSTRTWLPIQLRRTEPKISTNYFPPLAGTPLTAQTDYDLPAVLPQILSGHRLWAQAAGKVERFVAVHDLQFWQDAAAHTLWLRIYLLVEDLSRLNVSHQRMLSESGLASTFREVQSDVPGQICLEQIATQLCPNNYPADDLHHLVATVRPNLWMTVSSIPPYRRYYIYLCPPAELQHRLPQLLSMYATMFYLGSITRYRPHHFDALLRGAFGPRVRDFVTGQPLQFLYLMASEIARRDVAKPSIL
jgi:YaaC-like Protein